tara:strand:- start:1317 stop:1814 length:498 start_codon:yes stop_codon:yes gene_type:complete
MDDTKCMICYENYNYEINKPQILIPCGHNICEFCTVNLSNNKCPYCVQEIFTFAYNRSLLNNINFNKIQYNKINEDKMALNEAIIQNENLIKYLQSKNKIYKLNNNKLYYQLFKFKAEAQILRNNQILQNNIKQNNIKQRTSNKYINRMINTYDDINNNSYSDII